MSVPKGIDPQKLKSYTLFQDLTDEELGRFLKGSEIHEYSAEMAVVRQGEKAHGLGVLLSGKVKVSHEDEAGRKHFLTVLKEGDFFGEAALLDSGTRSATVETLEDTQVAWISAADFNELVAGASPMIARVLARMVADLSYRLRLLNERYVYVKLNARSNPGLPVG